ncbi:MAG: hypothetical protein H6538_00535 [Bacteroidales bacterium]|nr:hypothetical protein [Bacteroidales bacterium]MCB8998603.1 hypothetical protein [Bacteroidales bacterium]MCB9012529.1 hypothetical protein [Bacteroidales bacterium]
MNLPRMFKLPQHRTFTYRPMFHDPEKEEREARLRKIQLEEGMKESTGYTPTIQRGAMRSYFKRSQKAQKQSNVRLIIIIMFLLLISYLLLFR